MDSLAAVISSDDDFLSVLRGMAEIEARIAQDNPLSPVKPDVWEHHYNTRRELVATCESLEQYLQDHELSLCLDQKLKLQGRLGFLYRLRGGNLSATSEGTQGHKHLLRAVYLLEGCRRRAYVVGKDEDAAIARYASMYSPGCDDTRHSATASGAGPAGAPSAAAATAEQAAEQAEAEAEAEAASMHDVLLQHSARSSKNIVFDTAFADSLSYEFVETLVDTYDDVASQLAATADYKAALAVLRNAKAIYEHWAATSGEHLCHRREPEVVQGSARLHQHLLPDAPGAGHAQTVSTPSAATWPTATLTAPSTIGVAIPSSAGAAVAGPPSNAPTQSDLVETAEAASIDIDGDALSREADGILRAHSSMLAATEAVRSAEAGKQRDLLNARLAARRAAKSKVSQNQLPSGVTSSTGAATVADAAAACQVCPPQAMPAESSTGADASASALALAAALAERQSQLADVAGRVASRRARRAAGGGDTTGAHTTTTEDLVRIRRRAARMEYSMTCGMFLEAQIFSNAAMPSARGIDISDEDADYAARVRAQWLPADDSRAISATLYVKVLNRLLSQGQAKHVPRPSSASSPRVCGTTEEPAAAGEPRAVEVAPLVPQAVGPTAQDGPVAASLEVTFSYDYLDWIRSATSLADACINQLDIPHAGHLLSAARFQLAAVLNDSDMMRSEAFTSTQALLSLVFARYCLAILRLFLQISECREEFNETHFQEVCADRVKTFHECNPGIPVPKELTERRAVPCLKLTGAVVSFEGLLSCKESLLIEGLPIGAPNYCIPVMKTAEAVRPVFNDAIAHYRKCLPKFDLDAHTEEHLSILRDINRCYSYFADFLVPDARETASKVSLSSKHNVVEVAEWISLQEVRHEYLDMTISAPLNFRFWGNTTRQAQFDKASVLRRVADVKRSLGMLTDVEADGRYKEAGLLYDKFVFSFHEEFELQQRDRRKEDRLARFELEDGYISPYCLGLIGSAQCKMRRHHETAEKRSIAADQAAENYQAVIDICKQHKFGRKPGEDMYEELKMCHELILLLKEDPQKEATAPSAAPRSTVAMTTATSTARLSSTRVVPRTTTTTTARR